MKRRAFLSGLVVALPLAFAGGAAFALSYADDIVAQLNQMGFMDIETETTWLGRVRIIAHRSDGVREIVLNPRTGEILRDVWSPIEGVGEVRHVLDDIAEDARGGSDDHGGSSGGDDNSGSGSDDDHSGSGSGGGDDHSGSGGDDDNSGSGSGSSGSGSGGRDDDGRDREDREDREDRKDD